MQSSPLPGSIADGWLDFVGQLMPLTASPEQYANMRTAFYAGASLILRMTDRIAELPDEQRGVRILQRLHEEHRAFLRQLNARIHTERP